MIAVKGSSPTAKACAKGGRDEAKKVMKAMVTAAETNGVKFTCGQLPPEISRPTS